MGRGDTIAKVEEELDAKSQNIISHGDGKIWYNSRQWIRFFSC